tara:strand:- start:976 stop:1752 length:777 start_codon:yes stop_codon:yes gene_type:complete
LKVKEVTNFYFFEYLENYTGKTALKYSPTMFSTWLLVGTANFPTWSPMPYNDWGNREKFSRTLITNERKAKRFLSKNNVYKIPQPGEYPPIVSKSSRSITKFDICPPKFIPRPAWHSRKPKPHFPTKHFGFRRFDEPIIKKAHADKPFKIDRKKTGPGTYFFYKSKLYLAESEEDVINHIKQTELDHSQPNSGRERIPDQTQIFVWNRDDGTCVKCGSRENLAFDHIIPHSLGGSNSRRNLQLLCDTCNLKKSNKIGG